MCKIQAERKCNNAIINLNYKNDLLTKCKPKIFPWGHTPDSCWNRISRASNLVGAQHFPLCIRIFSRRPRCQPASHWIIVRTERVLHCKWQFVRVLWGFRYPSLSLSLFLSFSPSITRSVSLFTQPRDPACAPPPPAATLQPPPPPLALEIFQEQHSALGTVRFAKRGKSRDGTTAGVGIAFFCLVSACRTAAWKIRGWVVVSRRRGAGRTEDKETMVGGWDINTGWGNMIRAYFKVRWASLFLVRLVPPVYTTFLPLPSQYRRVQLIVSHFICRGGKNVAFPFSLPFPPYVRVNRRNLILLEQNDFSCWEWGYNLLQVDLTYNAYNCGPSKRVSVLRSCPLQFL